MSFVPDFQLPDGFFGGALGFSSIFVFLFCLAFSVCAIIIYAMQAIGLYSIGKRRGIRHSWLGWVPIGNMWLLGSISDRFQYVVRGREYNRRKILTGLIVLTLLVSIFSGLCVAVASAVKLFKISGGDILIGAFAAIFLISCVVWAVLSILILVFEYIALCDLYRSCVGVAAVPLMILSVVVCLAIPFAVFGVRNKDNGMIPKTEEIPQVCEEAPQACQAEPEPPRQAE